MSNISTPKVDLRTPPDFLADLTEFDGETIVGFRTLTEHGPLCNEPCLAPGSSSHSHATVVGYQLVTEVGIYEFTPDGICNRSSCLHSTASKRMLT